MKLIIDIPAETVNKIKDNVMFTGSISSDIRWDVTSAIVNGIPLEPQPKTGNWIPVSERLPEDNTKVIVTRDATYKEKVIITWYQDKEHGFLCGLVTAWQPLPEPYEPQEREDNE